MGSGAGWPATLDPFKAVIQAQSQADKADYITGSEQTLMRP